MGDRKLAGQEAASGGRMAESYLLRQFLLKMQNLEIQRAKEEDSPYIKEKLKKYILDDSDADWRQFFVAKAGSKTLAFARIIDYGDYFELASLGVDYYHRKRGIGRKMLLFLIEEARRLNPQKLIYGVTHRPHFLQPAGFKEVSAAPEALEYKKYNKCKLDPSKIKIMILDFSRRDG